MGTLTEDVQRFVRYQRLGFIATVNSDGTPALSHAGTLTVWDADHLVFVDLRSPRTAANIGRGGAAEIEVVDPIARKGYRFKGTGTVLTEGELHGEIVRHYQGERGIDPSRVRGIVLIEVTEARQIVSPAYDGGATEDEVRARWEQYYSRPSRMS